jgi:hypothetical protein
MTMGRKRAQSVFAWLRSKEAARNVRRAPGLSEKTGTHHSGTDGDEAEGDEEATCVVAIAVGSSATAVVVDRSVS